MATLFLISSKRYAWLTLRTESRATLLSVNIVAVRGWITLLCSDSIASRALHMVSYSAWLLEHLLSSFSFIWATISLPMKIAASNPTRCPCFFPSVYVSTVASSFPATYFIVTASAGCSQCLISTALSNTNV